MMIKKIVNRKMSFELSNEQQAVLLSNIVKHLKGKRITRLTLEFD